MKIRFCSLTALDFVYKHFSKDNIRVFDRGYDNSICTAIVKCYLMRWKIEEFYRFKKQTFNFEDIRVMSLGSMNNLNFLLNLLIGFLSMKFTEKADKPIIIMLINQVKRIFMPQNILYAVCAGIFSVFAITGLALNCTPQDNLLLGQLFLF